MDSEAQQTDARFERAVLEALHAGEAYVREPADAPSSWDPTERGFAEALHEAFKWRAVAAAARGW